MTSVISTLSVIILKMLYIIVLNMSTKYYSYKDFYGPFTDNHVLVFIYFLLISFIYISLRQPKKFSIRISILATIYILSKYLFPDLFDRYYAFSFYDSGGHLIKGRYVTLTSRTDPLVDLYLDMQPGFFWASAILFNILEGPITSFESPIFSFMVKWFEILTSLLYLAILPYILRMIGADNLGLAVLVFYGINFTHIHYHAQGYADAIYWLLMAALFKNLMYGEKLNRTNFITIVILVSSIVFLHQGVILVTVLFITSISLSLIFLGGDNDKAAGKQLLIVVVVSLALWFNYLLYLSKYQFSRSITLIKSIIFEPGFDVSEAITSSTYRPYKPWRDIVLLKAIYMASLILLSMLMRIAMYVKSRELVSLLQIISMVTLSAVIGNIAIYLGGAGYIERLIKWLSPLIAVSVMNTTLYKKRYIRSFYHTSMILLIFCGTLFYFSGRNFQSVPYTTDHLKYLSKYLDNFNIVRYFDYVVGIDGSLGGIRKNFVLITDQNLIQLLYYSLGEIDHLINYTREFVENFNTIYSTPSGILCLVK